VLGNGKPTSQLLRLLLSLFKGPWDATGNVANRALAPTTTAQEAEDYELGTQFGFIIGYNLQILLPAAFQLSIEGLKNDYFGTSKIHPHPMDPMVKHSSASKPHCKPGRLRVLCKSLVVFYIGLSDLSCSQQLRLHQTPYITWNPQLRFRQSTLFVVPSPSPRWSTPRNMSILKPACSSRFCTSTLQKVYPPTPSGKCSFFAAAANMF
jgi:hypothetical protein